MSHDHVKKIIFDLPIEDHYRQLDLLYKLHQNEGKIQQMGAKLENYQKKLSKEKISHEDKQWKALKRVSQELIVERKELRSSLRGEFKLDKIIERIKELKKLLKELERAWKNEKISQEVHEITRLDYLQQEQGELKKLEKIQSYTLLYFHDLKSRAAMWSQESEEARNDYLNESISKKEYHHQKKTFVNIVSNIRKRLIFLNKKILSVHP